jgi:hypothetical protein
MPIELSFHLKFIIRIFVKSPDSYFLRLSSIGSGFFESFSFESWSTLRTFFVTHVLGRSARAFQA